MIEAYAASSSATLLRRTALHSAPAACGRGLHSRRREISFASLLCRRRRNAFSAAPSIVYSRRIATRTWEMGPSPALTFCAPTDGKKGPEVFRDSVLFVVASVQGQGRVPFRELELADNEDQLRCFSPFFWRAQNSEIPATESGSGSCTELSIVRTGQLWNLRC